MTKWKEDRDHNILASTVLISNLHAYILIDYGAIHSFIPVCLPLEMFIPSGNVLNTDNIVKAVRINGRFRDGTLCIKYA